MTDVYPATAATPAARVRWKHDPKGRYVLCGILVDASCRWYEDGNVDAFMEHVRQSCASSVEPGEEIVYALVIAKSPPPASDVPVRQYPLTPDLKLVHSWVQRETPVAGGNGCALFDGVAAAIDMLTLRIPHDRVRLRRLYVYASSVGSQRMAVYSARSFRNDALALGLAMSKYKIFVSVVMSQGTQVPELWDIVTFSGFVQEQSMFTPYEDKRIDMFGAGLTGFNRIPRKAEDGPYALVYSVTAEHPNGGAMSVRLFVPRESVHQIQPLLPRWQTKALNCSLAAVEPHMRARIEKNAMVALVEMADAAAFRAWAEWLDVMQRNPTRLIQIAISEEHYLVLRPKQEAEASLPPCLVSYTPTPHVATGQLPAGNGQLRVTSYPMRFFAAVQTSPMPAHLPVPMPVPVPVAVTNPAVAGHVVPSVGRSIAPQAQQQHAMLTPQLSAAAAAVAAAAAAVNSASLGPTPQGAAVPPSYSQSAAAKHAVFQPLLQQAQQLAQARSAAAVSNPMAPTATPTPGMSVMTPSPTIGATPAASASTMHPSSTVQPSMMPTQPMHTIAPGQVVKTASSQQQQQLQQQQQQQQQQPAQQLPASSVPMTIPMTVPSQSVVMPQVQTQVVMLRTTDGQNHPAVVSMDAQGNVVSLQNASGQNIVLNPQQLATLKAHVLQARQNLIQQQQQQQLQQQQQQLQQLAAGTHAAQHVMNPADFARRQQTGTSAQSAQQLQMLQQRQQSLARTLQQQKPPPPQ